MISFRRFHFSAIFLSATVCLLLSGCRQSDDIKQPLVTAPSHASRVTSDSVWKRLYTDVMDNVLLHMKYFEEGRYDLSKKYVEAVDPVLVREMLEFKADSNLRTVYASIYGGIGNCKALMGNTEEGLTDFMKGYQIVLKEYGESHPLCLDACVGIASAYSIRGDYQNAIYWQQKGLQLTRKYFKGNPVEGNWYWNTAFYQSQQGNYTEALENYQKAAAIYETAYPSVYPSSCERIGDACVRIGRFQDARIWFQRGLIAAARLPDPVADRTTIYIGLAALELALRNAAGASAYLEQARVGLPNPNVPAYLVSEYHTQAAHLAEFQGNYRAAIDAYHQAIASNSFRHVVRCYDGMSQALGYVQNIDLQNDMARLEIKTGALDSALVTLQRILQTTVFDFNPVSPLDNPSLGGIPHSTFLISTLHLKASVFQALWQKNGQPKYRDAALATYDLAIDFIDKLNQGLRWESSKFTLENRAVPLYESAIGFYLQLEKAGVKGRFKEMAWEVSDKCKAVILLEQLGSGEFEKLPPAQQQLADRERSIRKEVAFLEQKLTSIKSQYRDSTTAAAVIDFQARLLDTQNRHSALMDSLRSTGNDLYKNRYDTPAATLYHIQNKVLKNRAAMIEYFAGDSTIYAFGFYAGILRSHEIVKDSTLMRQIRLLSSLSESPDCPIGVFQQAARNLYRQLVAPVFPDGANCRQLIFIPDGVLGHLPFHLLLNDDPDPEVVVAGDWRQLPYLLQHKTVRYDYAASLLQSQDQRHARSGFYAGFAPAFTGDAMAKRERDSLSMARFWRGGVIPDLKFNRPEVESVANLLSGQSFLASAATEKAFKDFAPGHAIIHLATHAFADDADPLYSQVLFTPTPGDSTEDGALHAFELYNMRLNAELAVLSACQTGAGKIQRGEGIMSMTRAFKYAGCPNIVMSLWNADDAVSKEIMIHFFQNLKNGLGKDAALQAAQMDYLNNSPKELAHPSRWATFMLIGDDAPVSSGSGAWIVALLTAFMAGLILWLFFVKRR